MEYKVVGTHLVDYVSKKTGNPVKGVTLHALCKDSQVNGEMASQIFVSDQLGIEGLFSLPIGCTVDVEYNNRGYVCAVNFTK